MYVDGHVDSLPYGREHGERHVAQGVERVCAQHLQHPGSSRVRVACVDGDLEHHVPWYVAGLTHLVEQPEEALIHDQEAPEAQLYAAHYVRHHVHEVVRASEAHAAHPPLRGPELAAEVPRRPGAGCHDDLELGVSGQLCEAGELLVVQQRGAHHDRDEPVHGHIPFLHLVYQGFEHLRPLDPRDLYAVVCAVWEALG